MSKYYLCHYLYINRLRQRNILLFPSIHDSLVIIQLIYNGLNRLKGCRQFQIPGNKTNYFRIKIHLLLFCQPVQGSDSFLFFQVNVRTINIFMLQEPCHVSVIQHCRRCVKPCICCLDAVILSTKGNFLCGHLIPQLILHGLQFHIQFRCNIT